MECLPVGFYHGYGDIISKYVFYRKWNFFKMSQLKIGPTGEVLGKPSCFTQGINL
jgi:hypothetical protein